MDKILSWGGGVNSTAIIAMHLLGRYSGKPELVFADTGAEMPETYAYVNDVGNMLVQKGWKVTVLRPYTHRELYKEGIEDNLTDYCLAKGWLPSRLFRNCTQQYKITPITNYRKQLAVNKKRWKDEVGQILGIAYDEKHRAKMLGSTHTKYPLIDEHIDREGCIKLIKKAGLPEAHKTGCFYCPFRRRQQWLDLYRKHPDLFAIAENMEKNKQAIRPDSDFYFKGKLPIRTQINKWIKMDKKKCQQQEFNEFGLEQHCFCHD